MEDLDQKIEDYAIGLFLRHYLTGEHIDLERPQIDVRRDMNLLKVHWAMSAEIHNFLNYVKTHHYEIPGSLNYRRVIDDVAARGRLDARQTLLTRQITGHPSLIVCDEPIRSFDTGPNRIIAWITLSAALHAEHVVRAGKEETPYFKPAQTTKMLSRDVMRVDKLRSSLASTNTRIKPRQDDLTNAARSRKRIYRECTLPYNLLLDIESGKTDVIRNLLENTLIAPISKWRRYEVAVGMGIGQAISEKIGEPLNMSLFFRKSNEPIITCGKYSIFWQSDCGAQRHDIRDESERMLKQVLDAYDMNAGSERPDLVVLDRETRKVTGIIEVKYLESDDNASNRFRQAASQIIRYARLYAPDDQVDDLIRRSLIALNIGTRSLTDESAVAPRFVNFRDILNGRLNEWVDERLLR